MRAAAESCSCARRGAVYDYDLTKRAGPIYH